MESSEDTARLLYVMAEIDGFANVAKDKYEFALESAEENGRDEPNKEDELVGIRRLIDEAKRGWCDFSQSQCPTPKSCGAENICQVRCC